VLAVGAARFGGTSIVGAAAGAHGLQDGCGVRVLPTRVLDGVGGHQQC
jgi:hypothetical protein